MSRAALVAEMTNMTIFQMRRDGYSVEEIAKKLVMPPIRVRMILSEAVQEIGKRAEGLRHEVFALDLARLEVATKAVMPAVEEGDLNAVNTMIKVQRRRAEMLGTDAPKASVVLTQEMKSSRPVKEFTTSDLERMVSEWSALDGESHRVQD